MLGESLEGVGAHLHSAVEAALKIAIQYGYNTGRPGRNGFAALENAYHGDTLGAVSVGYIESFHRPFRDVVFPVHRAEKDLQQA